MEPTPYISQVTKVCIKCKKEMLSYLDIKARAIICPECKRVNEFEEGQVRTYNSSIAKNTKNTFLPIGTKGEIKSIPYIVVGCAYKKEHLTNDFWLEYILYNPDSGVAYLTVYNGHWNYLYEINEPPKVKLGALHHEDIVYNLYSKYSIRIVEAEGEFPYKLSHTDRVRISEFISPPYLLSSEKRGEEITWFKGEYIEPKVIASSFNIASVPKRSGIGVIQPHNNTIREKTFIKVLIAMALVWFGMQWYFSEIAKSEIVYSNTFELVDSLSGKDIYTNSFDLKYGTKNVQINLNCDVSNSWEYTGFTLVNEKTGDNYDLEMEVEYYFGFEDGESWNEGSNSVYKFISSVPEGRYHLIIHPEKPMDSRPLILNVSVERDVYMASNGYILMLLFALYPAFYFLRKYWYDRRRWSSSNYSPYYE